MVVPRGVLCCRVDEGGMVVGTGYRVCGTSWDVPKLGTRSWMPTQVWAPPGYERCFSRQLLAKQPSSPATSIEQNFGMSLFAAVTLGSPRAAAETPLPAGGLELWDSGWHLHPSDTREARGSVCTKNLPALNAGAI